MSPIGSQRSLWLGAGATIVVIAAAVAGWALWPQPQGRADPDDARQVAAGAEIYKAHCASCHGDKLQGQPNWQVRMPNDRLPAPPHDETGHTWHHPDDQLFRLTKFGLRPPLAPEGYESDMPGFEDVLSDDEIWAVLAYIKRAWPPNIRARQQRMNRTAEK